MMMMMIMITMMMMAMSKEEWYWILLGSIGSAFYGAIFPLIGLLYSLLVASLTGPGNSEVKSKGEFYALMFLVVAAGHGLSGFFKE
eukprot:Pgem_evm1s18190